MTLSEKMPLIPLVPIIIAVCASMVSAVIAALVMNIQQSKKRQALIQENALLTQALDGLTAQYHTSNTEVASLTQALSDARASVSTLEAVVSAKEATLAEKQASLTTQVADMHTLQVSHTQLTQACATLEATLKQERVHTQEKLTQLEDNKKALKQEFNQLAQDIFEAKHKQFNEQSQASITHLLTPFREQMETFRQKVEAQHRDDTKERAALKNELQHLHQLNQKITLEASNLTKALKGDQKTQGNWGELILEKVLDRSGLRKGHEYKLEDSFTLSDSTRQRPDAVIYLPEGRHIIVDAKVSLNAYSQYVNADDEHEKAAALKSHIAAIKRHIHTLSEKAYQQIEALNSPDFVFMFMPIEPAFTAAFSADEGIFNEAFDKKIIVVTPTTLLASLRTVANIWSLERQNKSAKALADRGSKLYDKLRIVAEAMDKLGSQIATVQKTYDGAMNSFNKGNGNVISQAQKFLELGVRVKKELPTSMLEGTDIETVNDMPVQPAEA